MTIRLAIALVLLALTCACGAAQSQPPVPSATKNEGSKPQNQSAATHDKPAADPSGTENSPFVIKVLPTAKTDKQTADEQADRENQATAHWWTIGLSGLTMLVMIGQLIVYGIQARRLRETIIKMDQIATAQGVDMKKYIAEAARSATATEGLAASTLTAANAAKSSADIANKTLEISQRGWLSCTNWRLNKPLMEGADPDIECRICNTGNVGVRILEFIDCCIVATELPDVPDYSRGDILAMNHPLGVRIELQHLNLCRGALSTVEIEQLTATNPQVTLFIYGRCTYVDDFRERMLGWGVVLDHASSKLMSVKAAAYNYSD